MTIAAIETRYAGCRFRSRLEARWAVFLDRLGIAWQYEHQGYHVTHRLQFSEDTFPYLPDFWLPNDQLFLEVKGTLTDNECVRLLNAAASLSSNDGGGCHDNGGHDVVVCGRLDRAMGVPYRLHMHKGDLIATPWNPMDGVPGTGCRAFVPGFTIANDCEGVALHDGPVRSTARASEVLLTGAHPLDLPPAGSRVVLDALQAARSARFEHGEQG